MATPSVSTLWEDVLARFRADYPELFRVWFHDLSVGDMANGILPIYPANRWQASHLEKCSPYLARAAQFVTDRLLTVSIQSPRADADPGSPLDDRHHGTFPTFSTFAIGPENQLAHAAAVAAAAAETTPHNPALLVGPKGAGKTHLLQAACRHRIDADPEARCRYITADAFAAGFIEACESGSAHGFRREYEQLDLLAVDDLEGFSLRDRSQEEFFHILVTRLDCGRQVLLACDRLPGSIPDLAPRLASRFTCGLVATIDHPCFETRLRLAESLALELGLVLSGDAAAALAQHCGTAAEVVAAMGALCRKAPGPGGTLDAGIVREALADANVPVEVLISCVTARLGVDKVDLCRRRTTRSQKIAKQVALFLTTRLTVLGLPEVAEYFAVTIGDLLEAVREVTAQAAKDAKFAALLDEIARAAKNAVLSNDPCLGT